MTAKRGASSPARSRAPLDLLPSWARSVRSALDINRLIGLCGHPFAGLALQPAVGTRLLLRHRGLSLRSVYGSKQEMNRRFVGALLFCKQQIRQCLVVLARLDESSCALDASLHQLGTQFHSFIQMCQRFAGFAVRFQNRVSQLPVSRAFVWI